MAEARTFSDKKQGLFSQKIKGSFHNTSGPFPKDSRALSANDPTVKAGGTSGDGGSKKFVFDCCRIVI